MVINYVTSVYESMPSYRYRMRIPADNISHETIFSRYPVDADIHFFSKAFNPNELEMAESCSRVVYDLCDDWFIQEERSGLAKKFIASADIVTCPTAQMAERIFEETGVKAVVIGDPCEFEEMPPKPQDELNVMWFGMLTNIGTLNVNKYNCKLEIVTNTKPGSFNNVTLTPWSMGNMRKAFSRNNVVIIPSNPSKSKYVKSPNRLIESIRSGLFVIAAPLPSYLEFKDYVKLAWDIPEALKEPRDINKIINGQAYIRENYSQKVIGDKWDMLFTKMRYA